MQFNAGRCGFAAAIFFVFLTSVTSVSASSLDARLIIVGPGNPVYTYWGHIGIAVKNRDTGEDLFYDFGNFSFHSDNFYGDFAMGRMLYLGMVTPTDYFLAYSMHEDRDLVIYPLNLGDEEARRIDEKLKWWVKPENREYLYDYFRNNCSTIIRDVLDEATGGQLANASTGIDEYNFRHYTRTGASPSRAAEIMLHFLLGPAQDEPISDWKLMFLPQAVADIAGKLEYTGVDGNKRILAGDPIILKTSSRPPVPEEPGRLWNLMLLAGLLISTLWVLLRHYRPERKSLRISGSLLRSLIILIIGLPGFILTFLMLFTDHVSAYNNLNLGPSLPTVLIGLIFLIRSHRRIGDNRRIEEIRISWISTVNLLALALVMVLRITGLSIQDAYAFWAFYGPLLLATSRPGLALEERLLGRI